MITNADVTIYNRVSGNADNYDVWHKTVLHGVHVHIDHKVMLSDTALNSADVYKIRIPADIAEADRYRPPEEYGASSVSGYWTIQNGDLIVIGECQKEIEKPADLKGILDKHCKLMSWSDNRFGTLPHWRIEGE